MSETKLKTEGKNLLFVIIAAPVTIFALLSLGYAVCRWLNI
jgi:hypothetical protein